jgi:hypothetical protein
MLEDYSKYLVLHYQSKNKNLFWGSDKENRDWFFLDTQSQLFVLLKHLSTNFQQWAEEGEQKILADMVFFGFKIFVKFNSNRVSNLWN